MEGSLSVPAKSPWDKVKKSEIFAILCTILSTLTISMRYEPANAKFFETEVILISIVIVFCLIEVIFLIFPITNLFDFNKRNTYVPSKCVKSLTYV